MPDLFPTTHSTWLADRIAHAPDEARAHVMSRYFDPLCAYVRASASLRVLGEPSDLVNAFLAARISDATYLARWSASGLPLRRWLANGLLLHARNAVLASRRRAARQEPTDVGELDRTAHLRAADHETDALLALERRWAVRTVTETHEQIRAELHSEGRDAWWELFRLHTVQGKAYAEACAITGVPLGSASSIHRQVVDRLRGALVAILERDGIRREDIDAELASMQDLLEG
jgi:DNA-directed RNA polymerase specialized sigma24 family protein